MTASNTLLTQTKRHPTLNILRPNNDNPIQVHPNFVPYAPPTSSKVTAPL